MTTEADLIQQLDALEAQLPQMIRDHPDDGDFWCAFAGEADAIEDNAGDHGPLVIERITGMLAKHGRYLAGIDIEPEG